MKLFFFLPNGRLGVDALLCAERWDESMDRLSEAIGMLVLRSLCTADRGVDELFFPADSIHEMGDMGDSGPDGCSLLDQKTRKSIKRQYAIDYCVFGYGRGPNTTAPEGCGDEPPCGRCHFGARTAHGERTGWRCGGNFHAREEAGTDTNRRELIRANKREEGT